MNSTEDNFTNITANIAASGLTASRRIGRGAVLGWAGVAAAVVATAGLTLSVGIPTTGAAPPNEPPRVAVDDGWQARYVDCLRDAAHTADALEHWVEPCRQRATLEGTMAAAYLACVRSGPRTADALERWVEPCRHRAALEATEEAAYVECMRSAPSAPDALDHWTTGCRAHARSAAPPP
jgi:hypothetical protein